MYFKGFICFEFLPLPGGRVEGSKKLGTSAILFVRRGGRTGPARKGFGSSVERGGGGGADYGFNLCQDSFDANVGTVVLAAAGGPRERHTEHTRMGIFPEWPRPHARPTQTPSRVEPPTRCAQGRAQMLRGRGRCHCCACHLLASPEPGPGGGALPSPV